MITNKDIRVENGNLVLNGDKFPLDGHSPEAIMDIVEDNSDTTPTENSTAPVTSGGVFTALGTKQDDLTFDSAPTDASTNPVTSGGVYTAIDTVDTKIGDLTQTGVTGATVAAQLAALATGSLKVAEVSGGVGCTTADAQALGGYKTGGAEAVALSSLTGYPTGKTVVGWSLSAFGTGGTVLAVARVASGYIYLNAASSGSYTVNGFVFYTE